MTRETYHTDSAHGVRLPTGRRLRVVLERILRRQAQEAHAALNAGRVPNFQPWLPVMVETLTPLYAELAVWGARQAQQRLRTGERRGKSFEACSNRLFRSVRSVRTSHSKAVGAVTNLWDPSLTVGFDVFNPRVLDAVQQAVLAFCQSTIDTLTQDIQTALSGIRGTLGAGLQAGETTAQLNRRVGLLVSDPARASRIAQTEASRSIHLGGMIQAQESGVVQASKWLASSDACPRCLELNGRVVPLGQPFYVDPRGGAYAVCLHPPLHPHCFCAQTFVIEGVAAA